MSHYRNIYVACAGGGADLREFAPDGKMAWRLVGLDFCNTGDFDPASDGRDVYTPDKHYTMNYAGHTPGSEWSYKSYLWNPLKGYANPNNGNRSAVFRRLGPSQARFLFTSSQGRANPIQMFRKETPDEASTLPGGIGLDSFDVDNRGDLWTVGGGIRHLSFQGISPAGAPPYSLAKGAAEDIPIPPAIHQWTNPRIKYDRAHDTMYLLDTGNSPNNGQAARQAILCRFDRWSAGNRTPRYVTRLPEPNHSPNFMYAKPNGLDFFYFAMDMAGDKVFISELYGPIHVFQAATGAPVTVLNPGPEVSGLTAWEDENMDLRAFKRRNGEYVILEENSGFRAREDLYRWTPYPGQEEAALAQNVAALNNALGGKTMPQTLTRPPLTDAQFSFFHEEGYLVAEDVFTDADLLPVIAEITEAIDTRAQELVKAGEQSRTYDKLPFETRLAQISRETDKVALSIWNGTLSGPAFFHLITTPRLLDVAEQLCGSELIASSVYRLRPKIPHYNYGAVPWHQDSGYFEPYCDNSLVLTVWLPLVDADAENGCLWVMPRQHGGGVLPHRGDTNPPYLEITADELPAVEPVCVPVRKGSALLMTNRTPHVSFENKTDIVRWSMDLRYQSASLPTNALITRLEGESLPSREQGVPAACYPPEADFLVRSQKRPEQCLTDPAEFHRLRNQHIAAPMTARWG